MVRKETRGNYPAPPAIMAALVEGAQVDFDTACRIESRYFAKLASGQVSKNMINAFWTQLNQIKKGASRPQAYPAAADEESGRSWRRHDGSWHRLRIGGCRHGCGHDRRHARKCGRRQGQDRRHDGQARPAGRLTPEQAGRRPGPHRGARPITSRLAGCDLIIEAVFENRALKARVTAMAEAAMDPTGVFASNTSTLPITGSGRSQRPPGTVHRPALLLAGAQDAAGGDHCRRAARLTRRWPRRLTTCWPFGKVPIVVNDSRGFYTSRVFGTWTNEGMALLAEGQHPQAIEMAGLQAGMPVGPLAVLDEVSLSLVAHIRDQDNHGWRRAKARSTTYASGLCRSGQDAGARPSGPRRRRGFL